MHLALLLPRERLGGLTSRTIPRAAGFDNPSVSGSEHWTAPIRSLIPRLWPIRPTWRASSCDCAHIHASVVGRLAPIAHAIHSFS